MTPINLRIIVASAFFTAYAVVAQNVAQPVTPTADTFMRLETQANEASDRGDSKFFEALLSDKFVMRGVGEERLNKAAFVKMIAGFKCEVKTSSFDEQWMTKIDNDTYVFSYRRKLDGTCTESGSEPWKITSPDRAATVWIRSGDKWQPVFHGVNAIVDAKNAQIVASSVTPLNNDKVTRKSVSTNSLAAIERRVWEAWKARDLKGLDNLTATSLSFIDIFGNSYSNRDTILKTWSSNVCNVKSVRVTDAVEYSISPTVALLMHRGVADGSCYGQKIGAVNGNSIYVKEGAVWKLAFTMNMPTM